jgi:phage terminase large subunit-like protein
VLGGRVVACEWVRLACERQERDLARTDWAFTWDAWHANDICDFVEKLPHVEGTWPTPTITLEPWQVFILTTLFGWRRGEYRRFNTAYFEVARKNAKSTIASAIALYCLCCEGENGPQVKCAATTGGQARIVFDVCKKMVERTSDLQEAFSLDALANAIVCYQNGGNIQPINAKSSTQDGLNPSCVVLDELHAHKDRGLFDVLKSARGARKNPLSFYPTTAGYNMLGVCYEQRTMVTKILQNVWEGDHYFGIIYTLDEGDDIYDERVWKKANPNLGVSVQLEEMRGYATEARNSSDSEGEFKTKRLNLWLNAAGAWLNMTQWDACADSGLSIDDFVGQPCWIGADLAQNDDITAKANVFKRDGRLYAFVTLYLPREVVNERERAVPAYRQWVNLGILKITEGAMLDQGVVETDLRHDCQRFNVRAIRMDMFGSTLICGRLFNDGLPAAQMPKNAKSFTPATRDLETRVKHGQFRHDGNSCLKWMASNVVVERRTDDSLLPKKESAESPNKIDGIDAILQAMAALLAELEKPEPSYAMLVLGGRG